MSLDQTLEKKENSLTTNKSESIIFGEWLDYFEKTDKDKFFTWDETKKYFLESKKFLQSYQKLTPEVIKTFNEKVDTTQFGLTELCWWGIFSSAMIQTSYDQGFNSFQFEKISMKFGELEIGDFGSYLQGKSNNPIKIKAEKINAASILGYGKNCVLKVGSLTARFTLFKAEDCIVELTNYNGTNFGWEMKNCKIYSLNKPVLKKIKKQIHYGENNIFGLL
ncbi:hypothetical protein HY643_01405 [Candidatus Woesearchaeota archaeon]|nr:hypothetical protein [Candidatus Woesearchaeota archaeon]